MKRPALGVDTTTGRVDPDYVRAEPGKDGASERRSNEG